MFNLIFWVTEISFFNICNNKKERNRKYLQKVCELGNLIFCSLVANLYRFLCARQENFIKENNQKFVILFELRACLWFFSSKF